jgi:hypothetical protein
MATPTPTPTRTPTPTPTPVPVGVAPVAKFVAPAMVDQHAVIKALPGQQYKFGRAQDGKLEQIQPTLDVAGDNVIAIRRGNDLQLRYENGTTVTIDGFYSVCTDASVCSVELPAEAGQSVVLSGDAASGVAIGESDTLVYSHGSKDTLLAMAQSDSELTTALSSFSGWSGEVASTLPAVTAPGAASFSGFSPLGALGGIGAAAAQAAQAA